jgi:hypothetical protein
MARQRVIAFRIEISGDADAIEKIKKLQEEREKLSKAPGNIDVGDLAKRLTEDQKKLNEELDVQKSRFEALKKSISVYQTLSEELKEASNSFSRLSEEEKKSDIGVGLKTDIDALRRELSGLQGDVAVAFDFEELDYKEILRLRADLTDLREQFRLLGADANTELGDNLRKKISEVSVELRSLESEAKKQSIDVFESGSLDATKAEIKQITSLLSSLSDEEKNSDFGKSLQQNLESLNAKAKEMQTELKRVASVDFDIEEYRQLQKSLVSLQNEFNSLGEDAEEVSKSGLSEEIAKVTTRIKELEKQAKKQNIQLFESGSINAINAQIKQTKALISSLSEEEREGEIGRKLLADLDRLNGKAKELRAELRQAVNPDYTPGSYRALNQELIQLRRRWKELGEEARESTEGRELLSNIQRLDSKLKELDANVGQFQRNVGNYRDAFGGVLDLFSGSGGPIGSAIGGIKSIGGAFLAGGGIIAGLSAAVESLGEQIGQAIEDTRRFIRLEGDIQNITGLDSGAAQDVAINVGAIARVEEFQVDEKEITRAANALSENLLGGDVEKALKLVETGLLGGLNVSGDFLDRLIEYAPQFREAGQSAENLLETINVEIKSGVFSDKGVDAIKEVTERIGRLEKPAIEGLQQLGLDSVEIQKQLEEGSITVDNVIRQVSERIGELPENSTTARQAIEKIFGTPGVDAGRRFIEALKDVDGNIEEVTDETNRLFQIQKRQIEANRELESATADLANAFGDEFGSLETVGTRIQAVFVRIFAQIIGAFRPFIDAIKNGVEGFRNFISIFPPAVREINIFSAILDAILFPIRAIGEGLKLVSQGVLFLNKEITGFIKGNEAFSSFLEGIQQRLEAINELVRIAPAFFAGARSAIENFASKGSARIDIFNDSIQILGLRLRRLISFSDEAVEEIDKKISELSARKILNQAALDSGESFGESFVNGYKSKLSAINEATQNAAPTNSEALNSDNSEVKKVKKKTKTDAEIRAENERLKKAAKAREEIVKELVNLETELSESVLDKREAFLKRSAKNSIEEALGLDLDKATISKKITLIQSELSSALSEVAIERSNKLEALGKEIEERANRDLEKLVGLPPERLEIVSKEIKDTLVSEYTSIKNSRLEAINTAIKDADSRRDEELDRLVGSPEEIEQQARVINATYRSVFSSLSKEREEIEKESSASFLKLKKELEEEFQGRLSEELTAGGLIQLRVVKEILEKRLSLLENAKEEQRSLLENEAIDQTETLTYKLELESDPEKVAAINEEIKKVEEDLKKDLLKLDKDFAEKRKEIIQEVVPESKKAETEVKEATAEINQEKIDKILEQNEEFLEKKKKQKEEEEEIEKAIKEAAIDAAFELAESFAADQIERDKERLEEAKNERLRIAEEEAEGRLRAAAGNAEQEAAIRADLEKEKERINREAARERAKIARKEALINGALAATKVLATTAFPAAIPLLIAVAATTLAQVATIDANQFAEGGDLSEVLSGIILSGSAAEKKRTKKIKRIAREFSEERNNFSVNSLGLISKKSNIKQPEATFSQKDKSDFGSRDFGKGVFEGPITGASHINGGVKGTFKNEAVELEGGEYLLRNGNEVYVINKKSSRLFRKELDSIAGSPNRFSEEKREIASVVNSFNGFGKAFNRGGVLSGGIEKISYAGENLGMNLSLAAKDDVGEMVLWLKETTKSLRASINAVNKRIDRLQVINSPEETIREGEKIISKNKEL